MASLKEGYAKFECQKCEKPVELGKYVGLPLCPKCGTYLVRKPVPKHWIFQFNPTTYRWFDRIRETNEPEQWLTSQNAKLIRKDDLVAVWGAGKKSGIYAIGQVTTNPRIAPLNPKQEIYFLDKNGTEKYLEKPSVMVEYSKIALTKPILAEDCNDDPVLSDMQIFMNPEGTNFRLGNEQWLRIFSLLKEGT